jgi:hypothetical protein
LAAKVLLPGFADAYTSETFSVTAEGADTIDCSHLNHLAVVCAGTGSGSVQLEHTFDMTTWETFGSAITITSVGPTVLFDQSDGPFGVMRLDVTVSGGSIAPVKLVGFTQKHKH